MTVSAPESLVADEWLYDTLSANTTIAAAVGTRIYAELAPQGAAFPCIVFSALPSDDMMAVGAIRIWEDLEYNIRVIGQGESLSELQEVAAAIDDVLHAKSGTTASGTGLTVACTRLRESRYAEVYDGVPYRHLGGIYHILAQRA